MNAAVEWRIAFRNLFRNKRRTLTTAVGLVISITGISMVVGYTYQTDRSTYAYSIYKSHLGHISIFKEGGPEKLNVDFANYHINAEELGLIKEVLVPFENEFASQGGSITAEALLSTGEKSTPILLKGIPPEVDHFTSHHPAVKKYMDPVVFRLMDGVTLKEAVVESEDAISISTGVAELTGRAKPIKDMSTDEREMSIAGFDTEAQLNAVNALISMRHAVGVPILDDVSVVAPLRLVQDLTRTTGVGHYTIYLENPSRTGRLVQQISQAFRDKALNFEALPYYDMRIGYYYVGTVSFLATLASFIGVLMLGAAAFIIVNAVAMGILERQKEIGTLRAIGFRPSRIRALFVKESFWLTSFSGLIGVGLTEILIFIINNSKIHYEAPGVSYPIPMKILMPMEFYTIIILVIMLVSTALTYFMVGKKARARVAGLLLESKGSR